MADRYGLQSSIVRQEQVQDLIYDYVEEYSQSDKIFTVKSDKSTHHAKIVVLAVGGNAPHIPGMLPMQEMEGATHSMMIKEFPPQYVQKRIAARVPTSVLIVGGGLTSAQLADVAIRRGVSKVWLIMRGPLKLKAFDIGLEWVGKFRNFEQAAFWSADTDEERWEKYARARDGGSITPYYKRIMDRHVASGKLRVLLHTTVSQKEWDSESERWSVQLSSKDGSRHTSDSDNDDEELHAAKMTTLPSIDHIYFATGVGSDFERLPFLQSLQTQYPVANCKGFPCITENMAWRDDVPLFINGRFAALQLGPGAPNLIGARQGADRIAWSIQDILGTKEGGGSGGDAPGAKQREGRFNYVTGRGSRFDALAEN